MIQLLNEEPTMSAEDLMEACNIASINTAKAWRARILKQLTKQQELADVAA